ncbi:MAG TPA: PspC domain-containing protein [Bdellovibrionales bacterium]|nr:PspC domain-containing protein [Bdellovibrionales bacterium]
MKWVRAKDGALFGVCKGLARALGLPVGIFRLLWIFSVLFFGAGLWLYLMLAISLPREDKAVQALEPWILGVCAKISLRTDLEIGIVRFLTISLALMSLGATLIGYIVLYFVLEDKSASVSSDSKPNVPPVTT